MSQRNIPKNKKPVTTPGSASASSFPPGDDVDAVDAVLAKALNMVAESTGKVASTLPDIFVIPNDIAETVVSYIVQELSSYNAPLHMRQAHALTVGDLRQGLHEYLFGRKRTAPGRDMTPTPHQGSFDTLGVLTELTDRDKRKIQMVEDSFRRMEQQPPPREKKRTSDGPSSTKPIPTRANLGPNLRDKLVGTTARKQHREAVLRSLVFPDTIPPKPKNREHLEACLWFLETPQYLNWTNRDKLSEHNGVLWIKGIPGSGKSTLMRFLNTHATRYMKGTTIISFYFSFGGSGLQRSTAGLYRSLLTQLFQKRPDLQSLLDDVEHNRSWSIERLQPLLDRAVQNFGQASLICFIDALDECEETEIRGILKFLGDISQRAASSETSLRVCLSSRHIPSSKIKGLEFTLEAYGNSIVAYLEENLRIGRTEIAERIQFEIQKRASGNFKWATPVVDWVKKEYSKGANLDSVYLVLCQFPDDHKKLPEAISAYNKQQSQSLAPEAPVGSSKQVQRGQPNVISCDSCKRRHIKCDAKRPQCTQCVRIGRQCPGYSSQAPGHIVVPLATATDMLLPSGLRDLIQNNPENDLLMLDVRPSVLYAKSHIRGALNMCVPTTLQRRATFTLDKFQKVLETETEQAKFASWAKVKYLIIYNNTSSERDLVPVSNMFEKFMHEGFGGRRCLLKGGFLAFSAAFPSYMHFETPKPPKILNPPTRGSQPRLPVTITAAPVPGGTKLGSKDLVALNLLARSSAPAQTVPSPQSSPAQSSSVRNKTLALAEELPEVGIKCICNFVNYDSFKIRCHTCHTWQHTRCYYPNGICDYEHSCVDCKPRMFPLRANERQPQNQSNATRTNVSEEIPIKRPSLAHQDTRRTGVDPSPSDSGYATVSHASRIQVDRSQLDLDGDGDGSDDLHTVYTELASHSDVRTESYVDMFADDLFRRIGGTQLSVQMVQRLSNSLPTLLKALALTIGYQNQTQVQRDLMVFIHKQREAITRSFTGHYNHFHDFDSSEMTTSREPKSTEIMDRWLASSDEAKFEKFETEPPQEATEVLIQEDSAELKMIPDLEDYRKVLVDDPSYMWMLARLHRDLILSTVQYDILDQIRNEIQIEFPRTRNVSRKKAPEEVQVTFTVDWDILSFLNDQGYDIPHSEAIARCVTLTGTRTHAQALTCRQYMAQMWPLTGMQTLKVIQEALKTAERKKKLFFNTPCRLTLEILLDKGSFVKVIASGLPYFIAEIGEQLAWLGAALRPSLGKDKTYIYTPYLERAAPTLGDIPATVEFDVKYDMEICDPNIQKLNGNCWSHLFSNPVIAGGFPILHRQERDTGLEMPLGLMVAMTGTKYLNAFGSTIFIKGYNTMLVPAKHSKDLVTWHLLRSRHPSKHISYLSSDNTLAVVTMADLEKSRHVLGWCAEATSIVGTTLATYDIGRSCLPKAHSHHMLEKVEISAGQFVSGTAAFTLGNREKPVHITRYGFLTKLQWISSKYMVLWDQGDKRGWLVNGASALLHILRASLAHSKRKFQSAWLLDPDALKDPPDLTQPDASLQVLIDKHNRDLTLYMDKTEVFEENVREGATTSNSSRRQTRHYRLEDRIEHIYNILEKLIDHQADVERRSGLQINIRPRQHLEGWDFKDLVKDGDPIFPRVATLPTIGKGWVDFTRAIHAVTLFGTGFGELIQPRQTSLYPNICSRWSLLPKDSYYLAACVSSLLEIMEEDGDATSNPRRLCDNIIWHMKQATFCSCPCTTDSRKGHHDPVQVLFPIKFISNFPKKAQVDLKGTGAVIFGHNMRIHWYWKDFGHPIKGDPPMETWATIADSFEDSGIGSSLSSSRLLSASDPSSAGSTGEKSPVQSQLTAPPSYSEIALRPGAKRTLSGMFASVSKKAKR